MGNVVHSGYAAWLRWWGCLWWYARQCGFVVLFLSRSPTSCSRPPTSSPTSCSRPVVPVPACAHNYRWTVMICIHSLCLSEPHLCINLHVLFLFSLQFCVWYIHISVKGVLRALSQTQWHLEDLFSIIYIYIYIYCFFTWLKTCKKQ